MDRGRAPRLVALLPLLPVALGLGLAMSACQTSPSATPAVSGSTAPPIESPASAAPTTGGVPPSQTDTAWGRIWDGIPPSFPLPPGAVPATGVVEVVSEAFDIPTIGGGPGEVARFFIDALGAAGYTVNVNGPLEDGSFLVDGRLGDTGCEVQARTQPLGGLTRLTVLYGAQCPFE
jgi:hypothetical protein